MVTLDHVLSVCIKCGIAATSMALGLSVSSATAATSAVHIHTCCSGRQLLQGQPCRNAEGEGASRHARNEGTSAQKDTSVSLPPANLSIYLDAEGKQGATWQLCSRMDPAGHPSVAHHRGDVGQAENSCGDVVVAGGRGGACRMKRCMGSWMVCVGSRVVWVENMTGPKWVIIISCRRQGNSCGLRRYGGVGEAEASKGRLRTPARKLNQGKNGEYGKETSGGQWQWFTTT